MASTITMQQIVNLAATHVELIPLTGVGGFTNEPALSLCNDTLQELLSAPQDFKFNRAVMNVFATSPNRQDYLFAGATFFCPASSFSAGLDLASNNALTIVSTTVTIKTLEQYNGSIGDICYILGTGSSYDTTFTSNGIQTSFTGVQYTITNISGLTITATVSGGSPSGTSGAAGITDFSWAVECSIQASQTNQPILPTRHPEVVRMLPVDSTATTPSKVAVINDNGAGILTIRYWHVPSTVQWLGTIIYQKQPPLSTSLSSTWAPFPDHLSFVYRQMFFARCYRFLNSPRAEAEYQKAQEAIAKVLSGSDREMQDRHLVPETGLMTSLDQWAII